MDRLELETDKMFSDITEQVQSSIPHSFTGLLTVFTPHTTAGIALLENEILHLVDVRFFLDNMAPKTKPAEGLHRNTKYLHDMISLREGVPPEERVNGHSHIRSLFFSSSQIVPVVDGVLLLGEFKRIMFVELDPIRKREIVLMRVDESLK